MYKARDSEHLRSERGGFILVLSVMVFGSILLYLSVVLNFNSISREKAELNAQVLSALTAASNTDQKKFLFSAACSSLKISRFPNLDCNNQGIDGNEAQAMEVNRSAPGSSLGNETCNLKFSYFPRQGGTNGQLMRFCVLTECEDATGIFPLSKVKKSVIEGCISKPNAIAMVSVDMSSSLTNNFPDGASTKFIPPPSPYVYGEYLNQMSVSSSPYVQTYNNAGWSQATVRNLLYQYLPNGLRNYFDPATLKLSSAYSPSDINDLPFSTKETDLVGPFGNGDYAVQSSTNYIDLYPMCPVVDIPSGPDGRPDPIQFINGIPMATMNTANIPMFMDALTRDWMVGNINGVSEMLNGAQDVEGIFWRGGDVSRHYAMNTCFGGFSSTYKRAALQALYLLGQQQIPTGVVLFSNWLTTLFPLLPIKAFDEGIVRWNVGSEQVMGPSPAYLQSRGYLAKAPDDTSNDGDYVKMQFENNEIGIPPADQLDWTKMQRVIHPMEWCVGEMDKRISTASGSTPLSALPNPYDSSMALLPPADSTCSLPLTSYYRPENIMFDTGGKCFDRTSNTLPWFTPSSGAYPLYFTPTSADPDPANPYNIRSVCNVANNTPTIGSAISPTDGQILYPYRGCDIFEEPWRAPTDTAPRSKYNVAVALSGYAPGSHSPVGFGVYNSTNSPPGAGSIYNLFTNLEYPRRLSANNTFTPAAILQGIRALNNDYEFPNVNTKLHVIFTDGVPSVDLTSTIQRQYNGSGGIAQNDWLPLDAPGDLLPEYNAFPIIFNGDVYSYSSSIVETLHLIHWGKLLGIKYVFVVLPPQGEADISNLRSRSIFLWGLQKPLNTVSVSDAAGVDRKFHFCTPNNTGIINQTDDPGHDKDLGATCQTPIDLSLVQPDEGIELVYVPPPAIGLSQEVYQQQVLRSVSSTLTQLVRRWSLQK